MRTRLNYGPLRNSPIGEESVGFPLVARASLHALGVAPEVFQAVTLAEFGMEDMDENVIEIHDNPAAGREAVAVQRADARVAETAGNFIGDGFEVRLGRAVADQEKIGDVGNAAHIENDDVLGLLVEGDFAAKFGQFFGGEPASALH